MMNEEKPIEKQETTTPEMVMYRGKLIAKERAQELRERRSKLIKNAQQFKASKIGKLLGKPGLETVTKVKEHYKKQKEVVRLADTILNEADAEITQPPIEKIEDVNIQPEEEILTPLEQLKQVKSIRTRVSQKQNEQPPEPVTLKYGKTIQDPIIVRKDFEVYSVLNSIFGGSDGSYFIINENTITKFYPKEHKHKKFKIVYIADKNNFKYMVWFDITALSFIH